MKESKRALAHIEKIEWVKPIIGADNIELIGILGWECIAKKGEFKPNDICVYFEIDSLLPNDREWSEFMASKKYKVKTMKLSKFGVISQGLALPVDNIKELPKMLYIGQDVTDFLGVKYYIHEDNQRKASIDKYDVMLKRNPKLGKNKFFTYLLGRKWGKDILFLFYGDKNDSKTEFPKCFPYIHKTDETRIENVPKLLKYEKPLVVTEKLDGSSATYILERRGKNKYEFYVCSRNKRLPYPDDSIYWELAQKYNIEKKMREYLSSKGKIKPAYICIQGEAVGNVQGNPLKLKENDLYIFNFITSENGRVPNWLAEEIVRSWNMKWVPVLTEGFYMPEDITMQEFKELADGKSKLNKNVLREGLVYRNYEDNLSFKNVSNKFLLKKK